MDSPPETLSGQKSDCQSTFQRALAKYIDSLDDLPENTQKKNFIAACKNSSNTVTPQSVLDSFKKIEANQSKKSSMLSKVIKKVISALTDYDDIIKTLASADPMPTAIIWGALSVVIKGAQRYYDLFETIKNELRDLAIQIERVAEYEALFGDCPNLQKLLCDSYINMFRFWNRIHKEITKPGYKSVASAAFSSCSRKLGDIVKQMEDDAKKMEEWAGILEKKKAKDEWEKMNQDRNSQWDWRKQQDDERMKRTAYEWLQSAKVTLANIDRQEESQSQRMGGTCDWLIERPEYTAWRNRTTTPPVLLIYAPPASGKSTLCSRIIQSIQEADSAIAVVYHFYRFDEPFKALEVLKHFAHQLLKKYLESSYSRDVLKNLVDKAEGGIGLHCTEEIIILLVQYLPGVYLFLDGLDEASASETWIEAEKVLNLLLALTKRYPDTVRVWSSSQKVPCVSDKFKVYSSLHITDEMENDTIFYLSSEMDKLEFSEDKQSILRNLKDRAAGNFLWAKFIIRDLKRANSPADMTRIVEEGPTLDDYYKRFFERILANDRSLACYAFALVAFARRPLKIKELREAIAMLKSRDAGAPSLNRTEMPFIRTLRELFEPLIEVESDRGMEDDCICRLYHSTVLDFLCRNTQVLSNSLTAGLEISPNGIADACLLYLSQPRYSRLLSRSANSGQWLDLNNDPMVEHQFLAYSAKYWDKHLDCSHGEWPLDRECEGFVELQVRVEEFLNSSNFQTCIQVQSLCVDLHFGIFSVKDSPDEFLKRVLPDWLLPGSTNGQMYKIDYRSFWSEWHVLLDCGTSDDSYMGEIDRCWWAALGRKNFLSKMNSRYVTFRLETDEESGLGRRNGFEGVSAAGDELKILRLTNHCYENLRIECEHWKLSSDGPALWGKQILLVQKSSANWLQYVQYASEDSDSGSWMLWGDRAPFVAFGQNCQSLRIGAQIYTRNDDDEYDAVPMLCNKQGRVPYVEEFAMGSHFIALATRHGAIVDPKLQDVKAAKAAVNTLDSGRTQERGPDLMLSSQSRSGELGDRHGEDSGSDTSDEALSGIDGDDSETSCDSDNEAYESWSDCSSGDSEDSQSEGEILTPSQDPENDGEEDDSSGYESYSEDGDVEDSSGDYDHSQNAENNGEEDDYTDDGSYSEPGDEGVSGDYEYCEDPENDGEGYGSGYESLDSEDGDGEGRDAKSDDKETSESSSEESDVDPRAFRYGQRRNYGDDYGGDLSDEEGYCNVSPPRKKKKQLNVLSSPEPLASITVFDTRSPVPKIVFHFSQKLPCTLNDSPPVMHPSQSLVVWPLGGGNILFANFQGNTFFIRKLRASTLHTWQIFMKCHFSACGRFLHIATLEGVRKPVPKHRRNQDRVDHMMKLALLVSTHRLCNKQACRSPPSLVYHTRVKLEPVSFSPMSKLPFTLTWTPRDRKSVV